MLQVYIHFQPLPINMPNSRFIQYSLGVIITVVLTTVIVMWFEVTGRSHISAIAQHWNNEKKTSAEQAYIFSRIHKSFGYGGFIHNFKNLVLRQDISRIPLIERNINDIYNALDAYQETRLSAKELAAITTFRNTVDLYASKFELAKQLVAQGLSARLIDDQVRVDDSEALRALDSLAQSTHLNSHISDRIIDEELFRAMGFFNWAWTLIPLFSLTGGIIIYMLYRLTKSTASLEQARRYANDILQASPDALLVISPQGKILHSNIEAQQLFGYDSKELFCLQLEQLIPERFRKNHVSLRQQSFSSTDARPMSKSAELSALHKNGREIPVEISLSFSQQGEELQAIATIRDISERKEIETRLRLISKVLHESSEGILIMDHERRIIDMNEAFCRLTGYQREELLGQAPSMLRSGRHEESFYQNIWQQLAKHGHWKGEIWERRKNGEPTPNLMTISAVNDEKGDISHYVSIYADITLLKQKEHSLEQLAHFDQLTSLPNRMLCQDRLRASMHRAHRSKNSCALLYIDLDGFKQVNDKLGHETGDEVLIKVGKKLKQAIREDDTAARMGGDEFVVILNEIRDCQHAEELVQRILDTISFQVDSKQASLPVSASIGVALYPEHGNSIEHLMQCADKAMYYCKRHGKHGYHCFSEDLLYAS